MKKYVMRAVALMFAVFTGYCVTCFLVTAENTFFWLGLVSLGVAVLYGMRDN